MKEQLMKSYVALDERSLKRLSQVTIVLESTNIVQEEGQLYKYRYDLIKNDHELLIRSKNSILDRPNWKNEKYAIEIDKVTDSYHIKVYRRRNQSSTVVVDGEGGHSISKMTKSSMDSCSMNTYNFNSRVNNNSLSQFAKKG